MEPDPLTDELTEAVGDDLKLLLKLCEDFRQLVELVREVTARHHEIYRAWLAVVDEDTGRTVEGSGFVPRVVKN